MAPKPRFRQQFPKPAFWGALEEASASSELGCAGLGLIRRYALHVRDSGAADPSSLRESRRAAGLTEEKREERREQREGRREKREEKRMNIITDMRKERNKREDNVWKSEET